MIHKNVKTYHKSFAILLVNNRLCSNKHFVVIDECLLFQMKIVLEFINNPVLVAESLRHCSPIALQILKFFVLCRVFICMSQAEKLVYFDEFKDFLLVSQTLIATVDNDERVFETFKFSFSLFDLRMKKISAPVKGFSFLSNLDNVERL